MERSVHQFGLQIGLWKMVLILLTDIRRPSLKVSITTPWVWILFCIQKGTACMHS